MALLAMAVYDTEENERSEYTRQTLISLFETVNFTQHRLFIIDNNSCQKTKNIIDTFLRQSINITLITNETNVGTAAAINQAWKYRNPTEHLIKMDNDVVINGYGWVEELEEAIETDITIGIIGLKRKDLMENPFRNDEYKSTLRMLRHEEGKRWIIVEDVQHVMGTCQMYNWRLIDKMGGLMQMGGLYGFDDTLSSIRAKILCYKLCFLPHIEIDHIDEGGNAYTEWKRKYAGEQMKAFYETKQGLINGTIDVKVKL
ncbi:MAG: glycosyltransferase [Chitinophagia bacterium]